MNNNFGKKRKMVNSFPVFDGIFVRRGRVYTSGMMGNLCGTEETFEKTISNFTRGQYHLKLKLMNPHSAKSLKQR